MPPFTNIPYPNVPNVPGVPPLNRLVSELTQTPSPFGGIVVDFPPIDSQAIAQANNTIAGITPPANIWGIFGPLPNISAQLGINSRAASQTSLGIQPGGTTTDDGGNTIDVLNNTGTSVQTAVVSRATLSTFSVEFSAETRISDFPIENGGFASYNKAQLPSNPIVTLILEGSEDDRTYFLNAIDAACKSTDLYSVVTPTVTYGATATVAGYSLERYSYSRKADKGATLLMVEISLKEIRQVAASYTTAPSPINNPINSSATPQVNNGNTAPAAVPQSVLNDLSGKPQTAPAVAVAQGGS